MKSRFAACLLPVVGAFLLGAFGVAACQAAEPSSAAAIPAGLITIPAPPTLPRELSLSDEFDGRHLFFDTRFAYLRPGSLTFEAQWVTASGSPGDILPAGRTGTEKLAAETEARRLSLTSEVDPRNGGRTILRTIANGTELISTHFEQPSSAAASPNRHFVRLTLDESASLQRSLAQVQVRPETRAGEFALTQAGDVLPAAAILWKAGAVTLAGGVRATVVNEFDNRAGTTGDSGRGSQERYCRYLIDPDTHRLLRYEVWDLDSSHPRPERHYKPKDANGVVVGQTIDVPESASTVNYRRESYEHVSFGSAPLGSGLWALTIPDKYKEQPIPAVNLPPIPPGPAEGAFDAHALGLIRLWREASQRYLTLSASVDVLDHFEQRTNISRGPTPRFADTSVHYDVVIRRPGRARVTLHTLTPVPTNFRRRLNNGRDGVAVADGQQAVAVVDGNHGSRPFRDPAPLYSYILQAGLRDPFNALFYLFNPAPDTQYYDRIAYDGPQILDGRTVDVISLHRTLIPNGQLSKIQITIRCFLGSDGMPREIETRQQSDQNGRLERDQPPVNVRTVHYRNVLLDSTPPTNFTVPTE